MRSLHVLLLVVASACASSQGAITVPRAASAAPPKAPSSLDPCQSAIRAMFRGAPIAPEIRLLSTAGDPKAASYDAWLRALVAKSGAPIAYRWVSLETDDARQLGKRAGLEGMGVVIDYGVERTVLSLAKSADSNGVAWIAHTARDVVDRAEHRKRHVGFADEALFDALSGQLEQALPNHSLAAVDLAKGAPGDLDVLVLSGGEALDDAARRAVDAFLMRGNKTLIAMASAANVPPGSTRADVDAHGLDALLAPYGVDVTAEVIVDEKQSAVADSTRLPAVPIAQVDDASAPFFDLGRVAFPFASGLILAPTRQPGAKLRVIARTSASSEGLQGKGVEVGPGAPPPASRGSVGSRAVAVEAHGDIRSAFGAGHAPGRIFVLSSSRMLGDPFASSIVPADVRARLASAYLPQRSRAFVAMLNAIDADVIGDDERACHALFLADKPAIAAAPSDAHPQPLDVTETQLMSTDALARATSFRIDEPNQSSSATARTGKSARRARRPTKRTFAARSRISAR